MSAAGIFTLLANDGKADRMIMATEFLRKRIQKIICVRREMGAVDPTPTLLDIEKTHILYVNAHFKPYAACGFEYAKVRPNSGEPNWGQETQWNIPQFGDFFNDMVVNVNLPQVQATIGVVPAFPTPIGTQVPADDVKPTFSVSYKDNIAAKTFTKYTYEYVDLAGNVLATGSAARNFVRYAEWPGLAFFTKIKFDVNSNPLDEYDRNHSVFHKNYNIAPNKLTGWMRCLGQEIPKQAVSDVSTVSGSSLYGNSVTNLLDVNGTAAAAAPVSSSNTTRKLMQVLDGYQTPKAAQPPLELWIPLLFWFNRDTRLSIPSVAIPYGQRFITVTLTKIEDLMFVAPGNLFLRLTTEEFLDSAATGDTGVKTAIAIKSVNRTVTLTPVLAANSTIDPNVRINSMDLYINNIFVNTEIHDIYIKRIGFSLVRVHRYQSVRVSDASNEVLLSQLKWPIERMHIGMRPASNIAASNPDKYRDWHRLTAFDRHHIDSVSHSKASTWTPTDTYDKALNSNSKIAGERWTYSVPVPTIDELSLKAQSVPIYNDFKARFFTDYVPTNYGGELLSVPDDIGCAAINFAFYPGAYQPSGHINVSRTREFYLGYKSSYCTPSKPCDLIIDAIAINFLLITDGNAILRYTT